MPLPAASMQALAGLNDENALDAALALSLGLAGSPDEADFVGGGGENGAALPPEAGVSFANIAKMGFAATGPKLSPAAPEIGEAAFHTATKTTSSIDKLRGMSGCRIVSTTVAGYCQDCQHACC